MQVVLVMFRADGERRSFSVTRDVTIIGRREDCDLRIPLGDVSRKHCRIVRDGDNVRVEDLGSSNGTFHNGMPIQEVQLSPGDTVQVGPVVFCIQIDGIPSEDELQPIIAQPAEQYDESGGVTGGADGFAAASAAGAEVIAREGIEEVTEDHAALAPAEGQAEDEPVLEVFEEAEPVAQAPAEELGPEEEIQLGDFDLIVDEEAPQGSQTGEVIDTDEQHSDSKHQ